MGYYTMYELSVIDKNSDTIENKNTLTEIAKAFSEDKSEQEFFLEMIESCHEAKWYSYNEDMLELSTKFPEYTFQLDGNGEEQGDVWEAVYKNGTGKSRVQVCTFGEWEEMKPLKID